MTLNIIDTSNNNLGVPDATINAHGIIFKLSEGGALLDSDFVASYREARNAGKLTGVYDFARPDLNGPEDEAEAFVGKLRAFDAIGHSVIVLDWEHTPTNDVGWCKRFADYVYNATGIRVILYMNESTANAYDWSPVWHDYALWVAKYADMSPDFNWDMSNAGAMPDVKWPYGYAMWQWTSRGRLDGYGGNLDCSIFYGGVENWNAFATARPIVTTTTTETTNVQETTTTTTTEAPAPVETDSTTTSTTTETTTGQVEPDVTSTTTTESTTSAYPEAPAQEPSFIVAMFQAIRAVIVQIINRLRGVS